MAAYEDDEDSVFPIESDADISHARTVIRQMCGLVGVRGYDAQKVVTTVSELARNIARYVGKGEMRFALDTVEQRIVIVAKDEGPGIPNLDEILAGNYKSRTGLGRGLIGCRKLADHFDIQTSARGTHVRAEFRYGK
ncbi:putative serine/threonine protein kinase [Plesiocystis pacifica SIR-1]|uniref:Putative serine/threonine protein kinase n=1 Tax=Plesiocystis pacifica SIR-1 TaxID=391625 RepID=A6FYN6_9BACT|nr:ATP-binding protein [Plesiocystis pacifica]EDM81308.1 putative serine/threonine protein kinase [Plesiocystis pacifica SIR-1]